MKTKKKTRQTESEKIDSMILKILGSLLLLLHPNKSISGNPLLWHSKNSWIPNLHSQDRNLQTKNPQFSRIINNPRSPWPTKYTRFLPFIDLFLCMNRYSHECKFKSSTESHKPKSRTEPDRVTSYTRHNSEIFHRKRIRIWSSLSSILNSIRVDSHRLCRNSPSKKTSKTQKLRLEKLISIEGVGRQRLDQPQLSLPSFLPPSILALSLSIQLETEGNGTLLSVAVAIKFPTFQTDRNIRWSRPLKFLWERSTTETYWVRRSRPLGLALGPDQHLQGMNYKILPRAK